MLHRIRPLYFASIALVDILSTSSTSDTNKTVEIQKEKNYIENLLDLQWSLHNFGAQLMYNVFFSLGQGHGAENLPNECLFLLYNF